MGAQMQSGPDIPSDGPKLGGLILGKYRPLILLGQGGMGDVYLAAADGLGGIGQLVVVKRLRYVDDPRFVGMFNNEAKIARQLGHPNIVQTHEIGREGSAHYIVMEYLDGPNLRWLRNAVDDRGPGLPWAIELEILRNVLEGLHYAHELRGGDGRPLLLVHRDLSPENVIVTRTGETKILDFGIAKAANSSVQTQAGFVKGKLAHMPPEQLRGGPVDRRADVFSAGVLLFEGLSGRTLWGQLDPAAVSAQLLHGEIPPVRDLAPQIPEELIQICEQALAPDPSDRFDSAFDMNDALHAYAERHGLSFSRAQVAELVEPLFRRQRDEIDRTIRAQLAPPRARLSVVGPGPVGQLATAEVLSPAFGGPAPAARSRATASRRWMAGISLGVSAAAVFWLLQTRTAPAPGAQASDPPGLVGQPRPVDPGAPPLRPPVAAAEPPPPVDGERAGAAEAVPSAAPLAAARSAGATHPPPAAEARPLRVGAPGMRPVPPPATRSAKSRARDRGARRLALAAAASDLDARAPAAPPSAPAEEPAPAPAAPEEPETTAAAEPPAEGAASVFAPATVSASAEHRPAAGNAAAPSDPAPDPRALTAAPAAAGTAGSAPTPPRPTGVGPIFSSAPPAKLPGPPLPRAFAPADAEQLAGMCGRVESAVINLAGVSPEYARGITLPLQKAAERGAEVYPVAMYYFIVREAALKHDRATAAAALVAAQGDRLILRFKDLPAVENAR